MGQNLLPVESKIYKNRNIQPGSYYSRCAEGDTVSAVAETLKRMGFYLSYEGVYKRFALSVATDTPWHHVVHLCTKKCLIDHNVKFNLMGYVPPRCLECWKVVVKPNTLKQLFQLLEVEKSLGRASKCGIELRYYTPRLYGGYFYNNSLDEGRERYEEVRKAVDEHIGKDVKVILKRACTEYEMIKGPSAGWSMTKREHELDEELETLIDNYTPNTTGQNKQCIAQVHTHWIEWAWKAQDPTVKEYLGDYPLYPETMTYHEGDLDEIKMDMVRAKAMVKHNIAPEVVNSIHAAMRGFNMTKRVTTDQLGAVFGFEGINPLYRGEEIEL